MEIINKDFFDVIDNYKDNTFDMIILDPDYQDWDAFIAKGIIEKCMRVLKNDGNLLCFTKQPFDYNLRNSINPIFRREIIWTFDNGGAWCSSKMPLISFQKIYWCIKSKDFYFNPRTGKEYAEGTRDFKRTTKVFGGYEAEGREFKKSNEGIWLRDHLHYQKPKTREIPAKPKELMEILIKCFCRPEGIILDPFAGSGIIEQIATEKNMDAIAFEIDETRCNAILDALFAEVNT